MKIEQIGLKDRKGKPMVELVLPNFILKIAEVLTMGAEKYKPNSWQNVDNPIDTHYASALRHLLAYRKGEKLDKESGLEHLAHVATNIMFLIDHEENKRGTTK